MLYLCVKADRNIIGFYFGKKKDKTDRNKNVKTIKLFPIQKLYIVGCDAVWNCIR